MRRRRKLGAWSLQPRHVNERRVAQFRPESRPARTLAFGMEER